MKSEDQSSWWKPGNKDTLKYDDFKPQKPPVENPAEPKKEQYTRVQIEEDEEEDQENNEAEVAKKLESQAESLRKAEADAASKAKEADAMIQDYEARTKEAELKKSAAEA